MICFKAPIHHQNNKSGSSIFLVRHRSTGWKAFTFFIIGFVVTRNFQLYFSLSFVQPTILLCSILCLMALYFQGLRTENLNQLPGSCFLWWTAYNSVFEQTR